MSEVVGEAYVLLRPKADARFQAETSRILSKLTFAGIGKSALASVGLLTKETKSATIAAESQVAAITKVSAAAQSAAVFQVQEAIRVEDALRAEAVAYTNVAEAAIAGSRQQVTATNLAIDAEKRLAAQLKTTGAVAASSGASGAGGAAAVAASARRGAGGAAGSSASGAAGLAGAAASSAKLAAGLGVGIIALTGFRKALDSVVNGGAALETELNTFQAVTGAAADAMATARAEAFALGQDIKLPAVSAADAAVAMTELAKGGLSVQDSLDGVRGALELGTAANTDFATSAQIIARNLAAFQLPGTEASRVADLLAGASIAATGEVSDMAIALSQSAAVAHGAGISIQDTVTAIAQLAKAGLTGSDAGTSLRTFMLRLIPTTKKAAEQMSDLGVKVLDASGSLLPFPKIIESYQRALEPLSQAQRQMALNTIFGQDAIRSSTIFALGGAKAFEQTAKVVTKAGQANVLTTARTKGLAGSLGALQSNLETLALKLSGGTNPALKTFVDTINQGFTGIPATIKKVRDAFTVGGLTGNGSALEALKSTLQNMSPAARVAAIAVGGLAIAVGVLVAAAFPITSVVLAVGGLAAAFAYAYTHSERFRSIIDQVRATIAAQTPVWNQLRETAIAAMQGIRDTLQAAAAYITNTWDVVGHRVTIIARQAFAGTVVIVKNSLLAIKGAIDVFVGLFTLDWGRLWGGLKTIAQAGLSNVTVVLKTWGSVALGVFQGVWKSIEEESLRGVAAVLKVISKIPTKFSVGVGRFKKTVGFENPAKAALASVRGKLGDIASSREAKELSAAISTNTAKAMAAKTRDITEAVELPAKRAVKKVAAAIVPDAEDAGGKVGDAFSKGVGATISTAGENQIAAIQKRLADAVAETGRQVRDAVAGAQRNLDTLGSGLVAQIGQVIDNGPLGKILKRLQDAMAGRQANQQSAQLRKAIVDAQKGLAESQAAIVTTGAKPSKAQAAEIAKFLSPQKQALKDAQGAWRDFQTQTVIGGLQARQAELKATVQKRVENLTDQFNRGLITQDAFSKGITKLLEGQRVAFNLAGKTLGTAFGLGFSDQVAAVLTQAQAIQKGRDKGLPALLGGGSRPDIVEPLTVLGKQLKVQQEIRDELKRARTQQQAAADSKAAKAAAKKKGGGVDLDAITVGSTG